jgi:hypothetical protein
VMADDMGTGAARAVELARAAEAKPATRKP